MSLKGFTRTGHSPALRHAGVYSYRNALNPDVERAA
jgi:hypothetical protein